MAPSSRRAHRDPATGCGRTYGYDSAGRLTNYEGATMTAGGLKAHLSLSAGAYSFDNNGNMTNCTARRSVGITRIA